jgi:ribosomal protein S12 methylthiotransferase
MTKRSQNTYHLISLGCPKNLVDSESMAQLLNREGLLPVDSPEDAEFLIVNTCGFLKSAREEAVAVLTDLASEKLPWQKLIAAGCMVACHQQEIVDSIPGINGLIGTRQWMDIDAMLTQLKTQNPINPYRYFPKEGRLERDERGTRRAAVQGGSAYLKIADGCRRACAYCLIPSIKGTLVSRPMEKIVDDAKALQDSGIQEIVLIAQDTTDYGHDIGLKDGLTKLLEKLVRAVPEIPWIRIMYTYPGLITESLIALMASEKQVLPYLDIPLQHADPGILRSMQRPSDVGNIRDSLARIRASIPDIALRTAFIIGFPGEDEKVFDNLIRFVQNVRFDHLGVFTYSFEPGAPAEHLGDAIPEHVKVERMEYLMQVQAEISLERSRGFIGKTLDVLVEGVDEDEQISIGRSYRDAPEVDGLVVINGKAQVGQLVRVRINDAITHDLVGELLK